jgi:tRNA dimethylallyltransferase
VTSTGAPLDAAHRRVLVLCGPTGVGKTAVAVALARGHDLDVVSADSRQVYTWLDIGTAKPDRALRGEVGFHMIDMVAPDQAYSAADFARDALAVMRRLAARKRRFIVAGGSGLYLRALFEPFFEAPKPDAGLRQRLADEPSLTLHERLRKVDPDRARSLHPNDRQRVIRALEVFELTGRRMSDLVHEARSRSEFTPRYVVLTMKREALHRRIDARFDEMMAAGLLEEVKRLREAGFGRGAYVSNAYGYAELLRHLDGELTLGEAVAEAKAKSRAYAKRQLTWFRGLGAAEWLEFTDTADTGARLWPLIEPVLSGD